MATVNKNMNGSIVAGGNVENSNNGNKNNMSNDININRIRKESIIISFVVGLLSSVLGSVLFHLIVK